MPAVPTKFGFRDATTCTSTRPARWTNCCPHPDPNAQFEHINEQVQVYQTATFAVESIRRWSALMGQPLYPEPRQLLITADGGDSNGSRRRLWNYVISPSDKSRLTHLFHDGPIAQLLSL